MRAPPSNCRRTHTSTTPCPCAGQAEMSVTETPSATEPLGPTTWRGRLLSSNMIWAVALAIGCYFLGHWLGTRIANGNLAQTTSDQDDLAIFLGLIVAT